MVEKFEGIQHVVNKILKPGGHAYIILKILINMISYILMMQ